MATSLAQKLQLKQGQAVTLINAPKNYDAALRAAGLALGDAAPAPAVLLFVNNLEEAERLTGQAIAATADGGLLWVAYPKGSSGVKTDVNRDRLWPVLAAHGWRPVRQVAIDEVWSALRFRLADDLGRWQPPAAGG